VSRGDIKLIDAGKARLFGNPRSAYIDSGSGMCPDMLERLNG
jgi:hypothetical protein